MSKKGTDISEAVKEESAKPQGAGETGVVLAGEVLPTSLPIMPIRPRPLFPGIHIPLAVREDQLSVVEWALESAGQTLGLVLVRDVEGEDSAKNLYRVGVAGKILKAIKEDQGSAHVLISCLERFTIQEVGDTPQGLLARVKYHHATELSPNQELKAYAMAIISTLRELTSLNPLHSEAIRLFLSRSSLNDPGKLADFAASLTTADGKELQGILEALDVRQRIDRTLVLLKKELEVFKLQQRITKQIEEKMTSQQREFFLKEQLKAIKQELGLEKEGKAAEIEKFQERLKHLSLNPEAQQVVDEEMGKLEILEPLSPEYMVTRNYLDWLTILPWGQQSQDNYDLKRAKEVLDRDHFGLEDVKIRILEFIAVGKMKGDIAGSILCLVGPPGVGKTSIGMSMADALGRKFFHFSLGGMRDEAEIKGHRRTYIGAMPGKFIQALKSVGTSNPVIMLDEIDKVGASFRGDPASALLEVLDAEQNSYFRDHYLDVPFDLSNVLFVTTANQLDTIPAPLIDRMEIIRLSGYILEEKVEIARRYLIPKALKNHGLKRQQLSIRKDALLRIVDGYAREAGVRALEKQIRKIMRKAALKFSENFKGKLVVSKSDVETYLGGPVFTQEELLEDRPGIVTGLAWTNFGGATLQIEATAVASNRKGFKQTGQLGNVMVESSEIAYSYVMAHLEEYGAKSDFFDRHFVHLHVPAGSTPKDGPSAGITMAASLISVISQQKVKKKLGMTGELTLTGRVLPVGGVKEKVIAARRIGLDTLIFPEANEKDVSELPDYLRKGLTFHFARNFKDVHRWAF
ncbi:MAG: endopeptidase La [Acidobacteria bacterium]|nr:endopeptidase La [Acidobacteriota bacterium]MCZ6877561.1 endopeptidase La [Acidobacteriota bacterium]